MRYRRSVATPVDLGTLLFTAVEPHRGHEFDYNRWYETDHFYAGCLAGPHCFAGGRFVAPKRLKDLRSPATSPMCADPLGGSLLAIYWIQKGFHDEWSAWALDTVMDLHATGRMFSHRDHTHTAMYEHRTAHQRDTPIELALDRAFDGLVVTAGRLHEDASHNDVEAWTGAWSSHAFSQPWGPSVIGTSTMLPLPDDAPDVPANEPDDRRFIQLHFLDHDPSERWADGYGKWGDDLEATGLAAHVWTAPYIPTVPGTDRYIDDLW